MLEQALFANRGGADRQAVAAKPDCMARQACTGDFNAETSRV